MKRLRVLYVYSGDPKHPGWLTGDALVQPHIEWTPLGIDASGSAQRILAALTRGPSLSGFDLIISSEYFLAFGVNLRLLLTGCQTPHIVWGLNQSRRVLDQPVIHALANRVFARSDRVVTHSRAESAMFQNLHQLASAKFTFVPWGFDLPAIEPKAFLDDPQPYVCLVGRNNRDLATFAKACQLSGLRGVVITSTLTPSAREHLVDQGVRVFENLSFERCLACLRDSLFSAVLLNDDDRGAGHITMVAAMMLGKAQVVSDAQVIADYVESPAHALKVPLSDPSACAQAFRELATQDTLRRRMGEAAQAHALTHNSNRAIADHLLSLARTTTHS